MIFSDFHDFDRFLVMHKDDNSLFLQEMSDVQPLSTVNRQQAMQAEKTLTPGQLERQRAAQQELIDPNPLSLELRKRLQPHDFLQWKESGVQEGVWKKLRLGKYSMDATLDLHLFPVKEARQELHRFLLECQSNGIRTVLIRHGRGEQGPQKATIKSYTSQWLQEHDAVLAYHSALRQHGGTAAVYTMLRKSEEARLNNREQHARRSNC